TFFDQTDRPNSANRRAGLRAFRAAVAGARRARTGVRFSIAGTPRGLHRGGVARVQDGLSRAESFGSSENARARGSELAWSARTNGGRRAHRTCKIARRGTQNCELRVA